MHWQDFFLPRVEVRRFTLVTGVLLLFMITRGYGDLIQENHPGDLRGEKFTEKALAGKRAKL